ncbi:epsilon-sarcoglycan isoform X2 [Condylostylus longicornis]|uniref:epsilon-sarcoglycan isoform X2 n=1 Tax=Condylostylus longicornis TaxID=2530218 RepID=UPI00244D9FE6|nr:epsilon-sarcoglycan isoform X2 [Condylostylus longicornis]
MVAVLIRINFYIVLLLTFCNAMPFDRAPVGELFTKKIEAYMFNWTEQLTEQFKYRPSLEGCPDLPSWLRYMYSSEYHAGFLFGTPPESLSGQEVRLDIVGLNKKNYETRKITVSLYISPKFPSPNVIQMKIDNLNWVHLMDPGRVENLKNIFRKDLWPQSQQDLQLVFMESAINMGARLPLRPQQREGVVVHLGSSVPFSDRLKELQEEVRPLYKLQTCNYKRTSVQKIFENVGFKLDWCAFKILGIEISPEILFHNHDSRPHGELKRLNRWSGISKEETPHRNYIDEFAFAFAIPGAIFSVLFGLLSAALCFHHEKFSTKPETTQTVQMVHCSGETTNQPTTTLKSLKDPNMLLDNVSLQSQSPNNSLCRNGETSPRSGNNYLRPNPPPYKPTNSNRSIGDVSTRVLYC